MELLLNLHTLAHKSCWDRVVVEMTNLKVLGLISYPKKEICLLLGFFLFLGTQQCRQVIH